MERKIRVLLADDQSILADGIKSVLSTCPDLEVVGIAADGFEALTMTDMVKRDIYPAVCAYMKEVAETITAKKAAITSMHCPEADYFLEHMLPCYAQNLDELTRAEGD